MRYTISFCEDYRCNSSIGITAVDSTAANDENKNKNKNKNDYDDDTYVDTISIDLPSKQYGVYFYSSGACGMDDGTVTYLQEHDDRETAEQLCLEVHSHVNGCSPFVVTGFTGAYKETGSYGDPVPITHARIKEKIDVDEVEKPAVCFIINNTGSVIHKLSISPPA